MTEKLNPFSQQSYQDSNGRILHDKLMERFIYHLLYCPCIPVGSGANI